MTPNERETSARTYRPRRRSRTGRVVPYLAGMTVAVALLTGFIATLVDREDFPTLGDGIWWALVTLATVGYGDIVPHSAWGRVLGSVVIVFGITFLSFLTATVTSYFVTAQQERVAEDQREQREAEQDADVVILRRIEERLAAIEARLDELGK
jgi:voltage-gated potassium channel